MYYDKNQFDRLERKKYELSLKNNDILEFDNIFKLVIRLLDFGFINYLEELNSRITERDDVILDIIYYESVIFKLKNELENTNIDNIEEKRRILKINEGLINEYNNQNNLISKRIKKLKSITTFYSKYIHDFINWLVNVVNFKINERKIIKEKILNIILMYKNNVLFDLNDKDNSLMIFICNINSF